MARDTTQMKPIHVLLVEDNPGDADLARESLESSKVRVDLSVAIDGKKALDFLRKEGEHADAQSPDLILLDLNLPGMSGKEVLTEIRGDAKLKKIPVVILTSSEAERDVVQSYELGANCYITKPVDLDQFEEVVQSIETFWFTIVRLPS